MKVLLTVIVMVLITTMIFAYRIVESSSPEKYLKRGMKSYESARYNEAINDLNEYLSYEEDALNKTEGKLYLAKALKKTQKYQLAKNIFSEIIESELSSPMQKAKSIMEYADIMRITKTSDVYITAYLQQYTNFEDASIASDAYALLGCQMFFMKRYNEAISYFMMSKNETAMFALAELYAEIGEKERAFTIYEDIIKFYPKGETRDKAFALYTGGMKKQADIFYLQKNYAYAADYYKKLVSVLDDGDIREESIFYLGYSLYKEGKYKEALTSFEKTLGNLITTYDADSLLYSAMINMKLGRHKEAYAFFEKIVNEYPSHVYADRCVKYMEEIVSLYNVN